MNRSSDLALRSFDLALSLTWLSGLAPLRLAGRMMLLALPVMLRLWSLVMAVW